MRILFSCFLGVFLTMEFVVGQSHTQLPSQCPDNFQYVRKNHSGELLGRINVFAYEENVDLDVELSVGNGVQNNNGGHVSLVASRILVKENMPKYQLLTYTVNFPAWKQQPPRITKLKVNGEIVCSGPPVNANENITILSTIYLRHHFTQELSFMDAPPMQPQSNLSTSTADNCGIPVLPNPLIITGESAPFGDFPWLTAMYVLVSGGVEYKCSGTLVSHKHVITAAHCLQIFSQNNTPLSPDTVFVVLGKHEIKNLLIENGEKIVGVQDIKIHPEYIPLTADADIAVMTLAQEVEYTDFIRPLCIWSESDDLELIVGKKGKVVWWGKDEENKSLNVEPKQASINVASQEECLRSSEVYVYISSNRTFCAGNRNNAGPCNGNSGSGFMLERNGRWNLRGIVSTSLYDAATRSCDLSNYLVYTDVSKFRKWLLSIITL